MNQLILSCARITCYAALYCMSLLIGTLLVGEGQKEAREYFEVLLDVQKQLDKEADKASKE